MFKTYIEIALNALVISQVSKNWTWTSCVTKVL